MLCEEIKSLQFSDREAEAKKNEDTQVQTAASGLVPHPSAPPVYSSHCNSPRD